jgi:ATPase subunit of ABC transporter with duplicated ATPase domains
LKEKIIGRKNINMVKKIKKVAKALKKASALHKRQSKVIEKHIKEMKSYGKKKRDENPRDTVGIKFATPADAKATVAKVKKISKPFARKIQILTVGEQRAKVMGKSQVASIFKKGKEAIRKGRKT